MNKRWFLIVYCTVFLSACGQKGDLYLPQASEGDQSVSELPQERADEVRRDSEQY